MKLESIRSGDEAFLHLERYVVAGAKTYSSFAGRTEATRAYQPEGPASSFDLVTVHVPADRVSIFEAGPGERLKRIYASASDVVFPIHPETWSILDAEHMAAIRSFPRGRPIRVAPTASTRTVLTLDTEGVVPRHFIKLHYPRRISRFTRGLRRLNVHNSVAVTRDVAHLQLGQFAYLPDVFGVVFGEDDDAWGFLVRERTPRPFSAGRFLIPCFALYAGDLKAPGDLPLLVQIIEHLGAEPQSFVVNSIMAPVVECWAAAARERGVLLESHAQNTLLEVDGGFVPGRIVHRDFDVWIDFDARSRLGLGVPFMGSGLGSHGEPIEAYYSLVYDRFVGHEFFDYLLDVLRRFYAIDAVEVRESVKQIFHQAFPEADRVFPARTMYYFSKDPPAGRPYGLADMKQPPQWR